MILVPSREDLQILTALEMILPSQKVPLKDVRNGSIQVILARECTSAKKMNTTYRV